MIAPNAYQSHEQDVPAGVVPPRTDLDFIQNYQPDLPPVGCDYSESGVHGQALAFLMRIGREAIEAAEPYHDQATLNALIFQQGQQVTPSDTDLIANEIQSAVLSISDIQTKEPYTILIRPVQTRDKAKVFWIGPPIDQNVSAMTGLPIGLGMQPVIDPMTGQTMMQEQTDPATGLPMAQPGKADPYTGQQALETIQQPVMQPIDPETTPLQPLDEITAWQLKKLAMTGAFPAEWMVSVDDRLVADVYQSVFDLFWMEARGDDFVRDNLLCTNVFGYQTARYGWDDASKAHIIKPISIKQVFLGRQPDLTLANYFGYDEEMDVVRAKMEWPQLSTIIDEYAKIGYPSRVDSITQFGVGSDRQFLRRTVTFRVMWFRNTVYPMTPEEAEACGLAECETDPVTGQKGVSLDAADGYDGAAMIPFYLIKKVDSQGRPLVVESPEVECHLIPTEMEVCPVCQNRRCGPPRIPPHPVAYQAMVEAYQTFNKAVYTLMSADPHNHSHHPPLGPPPTASDKSQP